MQPDSPLWAALDAHGYQPIAFKWSGYCGGVPHPIIVPKESDIKTTLDLWRSEGEKLALFCRAIGLERAHALVHSHALQVLSFAAAGTAFVPFQRFDTVLSLAGPVREDMRMVRERARDHILRWVQVTDPDGDMRIREGQAFDGHLGWQYALPEADVNISAPGTGHSGLLDDLSKWDTLGLWRALDPLAVP